MKKLTKSFQLYIAVFLGGCLLLNGIIWLNLSSKSIDIDSFQYHDRLQQQFWRPELKNFCRKVNEQLQIESLNPLIQLQQPIRINATETSSRSISYYYSFWRSSPELVRRLTPCDHQLYMILLRLLDQFFREQQINYLMVDGTLLGSYMYHDFMPWDDDVDLRVALADRPRLHRLIKEKLNDVIQTSNITDQYGNYDRFYFPWTFRAGQNHWLYPYVDVFYFDENATHLWRAHTDAQSINDCAMPKVAVFPPVWRPLGSVWLSSPREPLIIFEYLHWTSLGETFYAKDYSHKYERSFRGIAGRVRIDQLYPYYPWIQRSCEETFCIERLFYHFKGQNLTVHEIRLEKYRIESQFHHKFANRSCSL